MSLLTLQQRLKSLALDPGPLDGVFGRRTEAAINEALDRITPSVVSTPEREAPAAAGVSAIINGQPKAKRTINEVIIHCAATPEGKDFTVADITRWHKERGFSTIGYHWVVYRDGSVHAGRLEASIGAHVSGHNADTLGVCYIGGLSANGTIAKDTRTPAQRAALTDLVKALVAKYPTIKKISGHNQYAAKACPSFDVRKDPLSKLV